MESRSEKIFTFKQLKAWQHCHNLTLEIYRVTKTFPADERFALIDQMRRAVISSVSNIAEGFARASNKERLQFYHIALGSLTEVQSQVFVAKDLGYLAEEQYQLLEDRIVECVKTLRGLIRSLA